MFKLVERGNFFIKNVFILLNNVDFLFKKIVFYFINFKCYLYS